VAIAFKGTTVSTPPLDSASVPVDIFFDHFGCILTQIDLMDIEDMTAAPLAPLPVE